MSSCEWFPGVRRSWRTWPIAASICLCITQVSTAGHASQAQQVPAKEPGLQPALDSTGERLPELPDSPGSLSAGDRLNTSATASSSLESDAEYPIAEPLPASNVDHIQVQAEHELRSEGHLLLDGHVTVVYGNYTVESEHIDYDEKSHYLTAEGGVRVHGRRAMEFLTATHGTFNLDDGTGRFFDVEGSIGMRASTSGKVYTVGNPFLFSGREVRKNGPEDFEIFDGSVTTCELPDPDWSLGSAHFVVHDGRATANRTVFRLRHLPILLLPYVTHPVPEESSQRQSGFLIPVIGQSSTKGIVLGEQIYFALSRSTDLTVGTEYFSRRGWQASGTLRYKGPGLEYAFAHFSSLLDRGYYGPVQSEAPNGTIVTQTGYINQGGQDLVFLGRKDFSPETRVAANTEYLSSYIYREAFTDNFNQAVVTDISSYVYGTHATNGFVSGAAVDRYQGLKRTLTGEQVRILHAPSLDFDALERRVGSTPLLWSLNAQSSAMKRTQGTESSQSQFDTGFVERLDVRPEVSLPFGLGGFRFRPTAAVRDTVYTASRAPSILPGSLPSERSSSLNRASFEGGLEVRTPVLEKDFAPRGLFRYLGSEVRHTIEPEARYRYVTGVDSYDQTLRFDARDVLSNTNELEYGVTQRLFFKPTNGCRKERAAIAQPDAQTTPPASSTMDPIPSDAGGPGLASGTSFEGAGIAAVSFNGDPVADCTPREGFRWRVVQKYFLNRSFGQNVLVDNRRNVLETTLDLSGVAFLTGERNASPIVSEMRFSPSGHFDVEWDMNYDTHAGKFTQSNTFVNFHAGNYFGGLSHARLNAPGRFETTTGTTATTSQTSDFSQMRMLVGFGSPTKPGPSIAANFGLDLLAAQPQYAAGQVAWNWNCCGISAEYRKFELGSVRNENSYRFNFTLANIGTAGNLRRAERLF